MNISEKDRPLYYIDCNFSPELGQDISEWNNISDFLPEMSEWVWDQLDYYVRRNIKIRKIGKDKRIKILSALKTARKYNATCHDNNTIHTVVTHLYVCELVLQVLSMIGGNDWSYGHGYSTPRDDIDDIFNLPVVLKSDGLSHKVHNLFFIKTLNPTIPSKTPKLKDYLMFCPELRKFMFENQNSIPKIIPCSEDFVCSGAHKKNGTYHAVQINTMDYYMLNIPVSGEKVEAKKKKDFPELQNYDIGNFFANFSVEDEILSDKFVSTTRDPQGKRFALGFGTSKLEKQRDIEIRFAIIFTLGSLGRYRPWIWDTMEEKNPEQYFAVKKFLEHNHIIFPYLILGYLSGKYFTFDKKTIWQ